MIALALATTGWAIGMTALVVRVVVQGVGDERAALATAWLDGYAAGYDSAHGRIGYTTNPHAKAGR